MKCVMMRKFIGLVTIVITFWTILWILSVDKKATSLSLYVSFVKNLKYKKNQILLEEEKNAHHHVRGEIEIAHNEEEKDRKIDLDSELLNNEEQDQLIVSENMIGRNETGDVNIFGTTIKNETENNKNSSFLPGWIPLSTFPFSKDEMIPVSLNFHNVFAGGFPEMTSTLTKDDILFALNKVKQIWQQAGIDILYSEKDAIAPKVPTNLQRGNFRKHLAKFPTNPVSGLPWTDTHKGQLMKIANDLTNCLPVEKGKSPESFWSRKNEIHAFAMGVYVGYNGLTMNKNIFIRTRKYHRLEKEMDIEQFGRILAHEIGHRFSLPHPAGMTRESTSVCSLGSTMCPTSETCNLMCQQRYYSDEINPSHALYLNQQQILKARDAAALLDGPVYDPEPKNENETIITLGPNIKQIPKAIMGVVRNTKIDRVQQFVTIPTTQDHNYLQLLGVRFRLHSNLKDYETYLNISSTSDGSCNHIVTNYRVYIPKFQTLSRHIFLDLENITKKCGSKNDIVGFTFEFSKPLPIAKIKQDYELTLTLSIS